MKKIHQKKKINKFFSFSFLHKKDGITFIYDHNVLVFYLIILWVQLKRLWSVEEFIPGIPPDSIPDLNSCLLYQQLQVINCCISRKRRRDIASQSLDIVLKDSSLNAEESAAVNDEIVANSVLYAKTNSGELIVRLGADRPFSDLTMLETGEPVYSPVTQV